MKSESGAYLGTAARCCASSHGVLPALPQKRLSYKESDGYGCNYIWMISNENWPRYWPTSITSTPFQNAI
ncbi:hypothetical protein CTI12_AA429750 [Artemisia annua]|uniref:Uncharacterized protein n=1 Tax=Artemisia annua TaxID=35608 RepID=A0A2U1M0Z0_ARTAN|nr:hypothetical protein CTI12_AA429750 [Artemisia annua]